MNRFEKKLKSGAAPHPCGHRSHPLGSIVFLCTFGLLWSGLTLAFDGFIGWGIYHQLRALSFSVTPGVITQSGLIEHTDSEGTSYSPGIKYTYNLDGKDFHGERYRWENMSSGKESARRAVAEYPAGKQVDVYYNPRDAAESLLHPGLDGMDLFMPLFLLPFNLVMAGIWIAAAVGIRRLVDLNYAGRCDFGSGGIRVPGRAPRVRPLYAAGVSAGLTAFALIFVIGFGFDADPSMPVMLIAWGLVFGVGAAVYVKARRKKAA
jgi:hypothetical protein